MTKQQTATATAAKLGILAGGGDLPQRVIQACEESGRHYVVIAFKGQTPETLVEGRPHFWTHLGAMSQTIRQLKDKEVEELIFIGSIKRPGLLDLRPDWRATKLLSRLGRNKGDDRLLRAIKDELEAEGFRFCGAHEIMTSLVAPEGVLGKHAPLEADWEDIKYGIDVVRKLGGLDIGQAAVVQQGMVLGVEAIEGTDALLSRCAGLRRGGDGGVLVKLCKPQQEEKLDMPTIGPQTIENAIESGLCGIALEAGRTLFIDREQVVRKADAAGIFIVGVTPEDACS